MDLETNSEIEMEDSEDLAGRDQYDTAELESENFTESANESMHFSEIQSELLDFEEPINKTIPSDNAEALPKTDTIKTTKLPTSRIKSIMKMDPDLHLASAEAVFLVTKAVELFTESLAKEAYSNTVRNKKKTVSKRDLDAVIETVDCLCFLEGALDF